MLSAGSTGRGQQQPPLRMRRLQPSIEAGVEPAAVADALNRALEEREAARADLDRVPTTNVLTQKKTAEIVDGLGNVAEVLNTADPSELAALYAALRLEMVYNAAAKIVGVSIRPSGRGVTVSEGVCEFTTSFTAVSGHRLHPTTRVERWECRSWWSRPCWSKDALKVRLLVSTGFLGGG
jgi:hypothetical protein